MNIYGVRGYLTPDNLPDERHCRTFSIPDDVQWLSVFMGALLPLIYPANWQMYGELTPEESAEAMLNVIWDAYEDDFGVCPSVETPYWDDSADVGDNEPSDMQTWYGEVTNPTAPPEELTFEENILVWTFTGLLALATPELGFAPAIAFHTIAPKFIIAQKRGDIATVIRIVLDGQDMATVDTSSYTAGDIIEIPVLGDESEEGHDLIVLNYLP